MSTGDVDDTAVVDGQPPLNRGKILPEKRLFQKRQSSTASSSSAASLDADGQDCHNQNMPSSTTTTSSSSCSCLSALPDDVLCRITCFLDCASLLRMQCLNHYYFTLARRNEAGWENLCSVLWKNKVHVHHVANHAHAAAAARGIGGDAAAAAATTAMAWAISTATATRVAAAAAAPLLGAQPTDNHSIATTTDTATAANTNIASLPSTTATTTTTTTTTSDDISNDINNSTNRFHPVSMMQAYRDSVQDAKERQYVTRQEFCFDASTMTGTIWSFRFKESAGVDWTSVDPWHNGGTCRKMVFLPNGAVKQYIPAAASTASTGTALGGRLEDTPAGMTWRFLTRPMDLPTRPLGSYVRMTVGGRDVPTYSVRRSPTGNWGFVMESCWGLYASFELPSKKVPEQQLQPTTTTRTTRTIPAAVQGNVNNVGVMQPNGPIVRQPPPLVAAAGAALPPLQQQLQVDHAARPQQHHHRDGRQPQRRLRRRGDGEGVLWVEMLASDDEEDNDDDDDTEQQERQGNGGRRNDSSPLVDPMDILRDDSSLLITNEIQWREAFLYNVGARVLPEGDEATDEFDRAWGEL